MPTTNILQLGDIHYPKYRHETFLDDKMSSGSRITGGLTKSLFASAMALIEKISVANPILFAAFVGDFTDGGNKDGFRDSINFFGGAFKAIGVKAVGIPGNHDLDWPNITSKGHNKFEVFEEMAMQSDLGIEISFANQKSFQVSEKRRAL